MVMLKKLGEHLQRLRRSRDASPSPTGPFHAGGPYDAPHRRAMALLEQALVARMEGRTDDHRDLLLDALIHETNAATQAPAGLTRAELQRSAAALAFHAGAYNVARDLAGQALVHATGEIRQRVQDLLVLIEAVPATPW